MHSVQVIKHEVCKQVTIMIMMMMTAIHETLTTFSLCVSPPPQAWRFFKTILSRRLYWAKEKLRRFKENVICQQNCIVLLSP